MTRSVEDIERDAEAARADLDRTVEALKEKMNPTNLANEAMNHVRSTPAAQRAIRLGHQAQDNAVPLALIGAGLAWMMINRNRGPHYETRTYVADYGTDVDYDAGPESGYLDGSQANGSGRMDAVRERVRGAAGSAKGAIGSGRERVGQALSSARGAVSSTASTAAERARMAASTAAERTRTAASATRERAVHYGHRAEETFTDTLEREPLIIGALGIAVGAAVAAALPSTPIENRYVGPLRDKALDEGKNRARQGVDQAKQVASAAARSLKEEADREGLTDVNGLVDKAERIVRSSVDTAKAEARGH
ncbi:MAG TPA: DUF3618 domain-containing protein [Caulobacteraceae bacterium]|nr:DUF3618 domain-containing protein [Caulobacteraceae bacterium]